MRRIVFGAFALFFLTFLSIKVGLVHAAVSGCDADVNQDGKVNTTDYLLIVNSFLRSPPNPLRADITKDGVVNVSDYTSFVAFFLQPVESCVNPTPTPAPSTPSPVSCTSKQYYVSPTGNDSATGAQSAPLRTITKAVSLATSQSTCVAILIQPGIYRETVKIENIQRTASTAITLQALQGKQTVFVVGSESGNGLSWQKTTDSLPFPSVAGSHIYRADISAWNAVPQIAVRTAGTQIRLPIAHEPDFEVQTSWKYHENFWKAEGRSGETLNTLIDGVNDPAGSYPQAALLAGNLKSINGFSGSFLTGARIFVRDTYTAHDSYTAKITAHDTNSGQITLDKDLKYFSGQPLIGNNSKYYIEGKPQLLDTPGEWYVDSTTKRLYIWPPGDVAPSTQSLEFATRPNGILISNASNFNFKHIDVSYVNNAYSTYYDSEAAVSLWNKPNQNTSNIVFDGVTIKHAGVGFRIFQSVGNGELTKNITFSNGEIGHTDSFNFATFHWNHTNGSVQGINRLIVQNNEFHHGGFRSTFGGDMVVFGHSRELLITGNWVHDAAHNGLGITGGVETKALVQHNVFENNCLDGSDCGGFKIYSGGSSTNDILLSHNLLRNNVGWSWASAATNKFVNPRGPGFGGFGYYADGNQSARPGTTRAATVYKNVAVDNAAEGFKLTKSRDQLFYDNVSINNGTIAFSMYTSSSDPDANFYSGFHNNIMVNTLNVPTSGTKTGIYIMLSDANKSQVTASNNIYSFSGSTPWYPIARETPGDYSNRVLYTASTLSTSIWNTGTTISTAVPKLTGGQRESLTSIYQTYGKSPAAPSAEIVALQNKLSALFGVPIDDDMYAGR